MMSPDKRSFRVALIADRYVNPPPGGLDGLAAATQAGWGVMQLPAPDYPADLITRMLAEIAEHVDEFQRHGYDLVLVGECGGLAEALAAVGMDPLDSFNPSSAAGLLAFLHARSTPPAGGGGPPPKALPPIDRAAGSGP
jgi:hypothetical protein